MYPSGPQGSYRARSRGYDGQRPSGGYSNKYDTRKSYHLQKNHNFSNRNYTTTNTNTNAAYNPSGSSSSLTYRSRQDLYQQQNVSRSSYDQQYQMWMGDLDPNWTEQIIGDMWSTLVGPPSSVKIMRDRINPSKPSYAFVTFNSREALDLAVQRNGQLVPNSQQRFKLNFATSKNNVNTNFSSNTGTNSNTGEYSLFIGDLAPEVTEAVLFSKFDSKYPKQIRNARVIIDPTTKKGRGFGFVKFFAADVMNKALTEMQGQMIGSKAIRVGIAAGSEVTHPVSSEARNEYQRIHIPQSYPDINPNTDENNTTIKITGLSSKFTEKELEQYFICFGDIVYCRLSNDLRTAHIKFLLRSSANAAMTHLNGMTINECRVKLNWGNSTQVEGGPINFEANTNVAYEKSEPIPLVYFSRDYPAQRLDQLDEEQISEFIHRKDSSQVSATRQINALYLDKKLAREALLS
ncbi:hypothetical protein KGF56_003743 [Candida oxycetoniae]|uniref:RRM domain-containing protein n=1 Tax=Candida oxycetoniae TaxID=497107 RepID=A0AAI9WWZ4_9ASCO|nr:uncharacterized protein KGF56_003743 [Candida oxycetoniae]KAI3403459.2 hypothetical protein KGF56_003743 [Candida oxycetoniae]